MYGKRKALGTLLACFVLLAAASCFEPQVTFLATATGSISQSSDSHQYATQKTDAATTPRLGSDTSVTVVPDSPTRTIAVVVESVLYSGISDSVAQYLDDLRKTGFDTILHTDYIATHQQLKALLTNWSEASELIGAVLIGRLPYAEFHHERTANFDPETFVCDLYLMDLDGTWDDVNPADGVFDSHYATDNADIYPEIFVSRIDPTCLTWGGGAVNQTRAYLERLHDYRTGGLQRENRALVYVDDDWSGFWGTTWNAGIGLSYPVRTLVQLPLYTNASDWKLNRITQDYQWAHLCAHSSATTHYFGPTGVGQGTVTSAEIRAAPPSFNFYNLFCCSGAEWTTTDNLAVTYVFSGPYSVAAVGSTKTGSMMDCEHFYGPLGLNMSVGESLVQWFGEALADDSEAGNEYLPWYYGMAIVGDPLATIEYDCTVLSPDVSSPTHLNQAGWYDNTKPLFEWSAPEDVNGISGYYYVVDRLPTTTPTPDNAIETDTNYTQTVTDLADGTWYFHVVARDGVGNMGKAAAHFRVNIDTSEPSISVVSPSEKFNSSMSSLMLEWEPGDSTSGCSRTEIRLDSVGEPVYNGTAVSYELVGLTEGIHIVNFTVFDLAGNSHSESLSIMTDLTDPIVEITSPMNLAQVDPDITVVWTAEDGESGYRVASLTVDHVQAGLISAPDTTFLITGLSWGMHLLNVTVYDWASRSASYAVQVIVWTLEGQAVLVVGIVVVVSLVGLTWQRARSGRRSGS